MHYSTIENLYSIFCDHPTVTTDSRDVPAGSIFFALKGDSFDGNRFALSALEKGAAYAVIDDSSVYASLPDDAKERVILTADVLTTLQDLARHHRQALGTRTIAVTGTNGKTTTKELITAVLRTHHNVLCTEGNFNNHIGVPKTVLRLTAAHTAAVVEMGANHPGEIKTLAAIVHPDYGIITNVGKAHLEGFGSFEGVIRTKGELYDQLLKDHGTILINSDNPHLTALADAMDIEKIRYGQKAEGDLLVRGELIECDPFLKFRWWSSSDGNTVHEVQTKLIGAYNLDNALAAVCAGLVFGVPADKICEGLSLYTPTNNRSQLKQTASNLLVVDAYNANPSSMAVAIDNFRLLKAEHKMCILGAMKELGESSREEHQAVINRLSDCGFERVWLVGEEYGEAMTHRDINEVKAAIAAESPKGYTILIKGSNSMKLTQAVDLL